jgi:hypothetical protein
MTKLLKFILPVGLGLSLLTITIMAVMSTTLVSCELLDACGDGYCKASDGQCYKCSDGSACSSTAQAGYTLTTQGHIYCYSGSGGSSGGGSTAYCSSGNTYNYSSQKCCPNSAPYYYPGTHGIKAAGCYSSCPYVGDCGTQFTKY